MIFLGCDGGSTKTEWVLADENGRVLAHRIFAGCNYAFLGGEGFARLMGDSCRALLADAGVGPEAVTAAMLGLTLYGEMPGTEQAIPAAVAAALPGCGPIAVENDSVAGWAGSLAGRAGINVVAGTGSVAYGRDPGRHGCRVGGWSLFFADEGSCSWIARQLVTEFVKQADGRRPRTAIYEQVRRQVPVEKDIYFAGYLQSDVRQDSSLLAQLQLAALRAAEQDDGTALAIYERAAAELAEMASAIRAQLDFPAGEPVTVSGSGGLFRAGEIIQRPFRAAMEAAGFQTAQPLYSPVIGALALAAEDHLPPEAVQALLRRASQQIK